MCRISKVWRHGSPKPMLCKFRPFQEYGRPRRTIQEPRTRRVRSSFFALSIMSITIPKAPKRYFVGDFAVWAVFFSLCILSLIEVYSAGSYLTIEAHSYVSPLVRQMSYLGLAALAAFVVQSFIFATSIIWLCSVDSLLLFCFFPPTSSDRTSTTVRAGFLFSV